ncbi:chloride channel protein [Desulfoprunum benzoelyticum]|uniref:CIC family chloride channel protein n=1 Tax=Desulfoprunum benzoelyticum TaxID=1506996 RepID=A0A840V1C0_9BACT|nr:chloride channel protein [Desulfoprunum benzoelyticum]MBB5347630.1 CIC family chloride channel protein [Desulfoprunum benzoelyticum]MBM9529241.1 chloride channel protein [Desulfoprunum benzoelyticum]
MRKNIRKFLPGENTRMMLIATCIGLGAGLMTIVFRSLVDAVDALIFEGGASLLGIGQGGWRLLLLPLLPLVGMVLLIPLSLLFPGEVNGYGLPAFLRKVNLENGIIRARSIAIKIIATALTIGTGNSAGVEGPIAQIGGAIGSQAGQFFRVSGSRMKVFIAAGAAGGIAGMFNAPIAGIFFAAEIVLLGTYEISSFAALVIASAMATVVTRGWYGEMSVFTIPQYSVVNYLVEIPLYCLLAIFIGLAAVLFIRVFYAVRDRYREIGLHPQLKPLTGALLIGCIGIFFPQVMGDGYDYMEDILHGQGIAWVMLTLVLLKILATSITLGSGGAGGVFAPSLFIGAVLGGAFGSITHRLMPDLTAGSGAYATVGIGAFLAAATHAPMTAIFLLFEMTGNYQIIIPIMITSIIGTVVARKFCEDSIDTVDFSRAGINIHEGRETVILKSLKVGAAISDEVDFISEEANIKELLQIFSIGKGFYFPVIDATGKMTGIVSLQDVKNILHREEKERIAYKVGGICNRNIIMLTPDDSLFAAMQLFDIKGIEEIPVVESLDERWVVGMLKRRDVLDLYKREVLRRGISAKVGSQGLGSR